MEKVIAGSLEDLVPEVLDRKRREDGADKDLTHEGMLEVLRKQLKDKDLRPDYAAKIVDTLFKLDPPSDTATREIKKLSNQELLEQIFDTLVPVLRYFDIQPAKARPDTTVKRKKKHLKLTGVEAKEIRELYATGDWTQKALAERYKVSSVNINLIIHNRTHRDPAYEPPPKNRV